ncbi:MAG: hypothetical protein KTR17_09850 [Cellvibrionaceae bacterium]|nr:hypothetical protein [Cellvibrionaceae bacterium]
MEQANQFSTPIAPVKHFTNPSVAQKQLLREIHCLERQLDRLRVRTDLLDESTLSDYREMIHSRQMILNQLNYNK